MRLLGLDYGEKRIGVAVSDPLGLTAQGVMIIGRKSLEEDFQELKKVIDKYEVEKIVIGLPRTLRGEIGPQASKVLEFAKKLEEGLKLPIITWDERLSTVAVERTLRQAEVTRSKRKKVVDKMAAMYVLQGYLDSIKSK